MRMLRQRIRKVSWPLEIWILQPLCTDQSNYHNKQPYISAAYPNQSLWATHITIWSNIQQRPTTRGFRDPGSFLLVISLSSGPWSSPWTTSSWWRIKRPRMWPPVWAEGKWASWCTRLERSQKHRVGGGQRRESKRWTLVPGHLSSVACYAPSFTLPHAESQHPHMSSGARKSHCDFLCLQEQLILGVFWARVSLNN